ncbi:MAG: RNA-directed DNA polymerase [Candidatus Pacebacteria bacterium]|nr:RNA-directed DNA polymerase [Candidatus Paceibacterota bacterium]
MSIKIKQLKRQAQKLNQRVKLAYTQARKRKKWKLNTLQFSLELESNCLKLAKEIEKRQYNIKPSLAFICFQPIKREIFAGDFRDRVVHHYVFTKLYHHYDKLLINDCYSCRLNKGTGYGIKRANSYLRSVSSNFKKPAYVLKLDISGYFMSINRDVLYQINKDLIKKIFKNNEYEKSTLLYLLKKIIFNDPTLNCKIKGKHQDWYKLPKNKSLFFAKNNCGLPIGNLTSQLFGNIYLNGLDHYIKEKLKCRYYGRYVDDMFFMHEDKEFLKDLIPKISKYLQDNLSLELHPQKIYLQEINKGLPFLGAIIKPHRIYPGKRIIKSFREKISLVVERKLTNPSFFNSYLGQLKKYNSYNLRKKIMTEAKTVLALEILKYEVNDNYSKIEPKKTLFSHDRATGNE